MDNLTDEEIEKIVIDECGRAMLHLIASARRLGHCTLKGHLVYQHEKRETISGDAIGWLRWMIAHNENSRNEIGYPEELGSFAERWFVNKTMESLKGAM
jgi:hypothetical protein